jgi:hypothetical protein
MVINFLMVIMVIVVIIVGLQSWIIYKDVSKVWPKIGPKKVIQKI